MDFQSCPECEALNPPGAKQCEQCKALLPEVPEFSPPPPPAPPVLEPEPQPEPEPAPAEEGDRPFAAPPQILARVEQLEADIEKKPNANGLYLQLSQVYAEGDRRDLAVRTLERCLEHDPKNVYIRHRLSQLTGVPEAPVLPAPPGSPPGSSAGTTKPAHPAPGRLGGRPPTSTVQPVRRPARPTPRRARRRRPSRAVVLGGALALGALAVGAKLLLFPGPRCVVTGSFSAVGPKWSPTGKHFAFLMQEGERTQLGLYDRKTGEHRALAEVLGFDSSAYEWSPEGDRIAYVGTGSDAWEEAVYVLDAESGTKRYVATGRAPSWSSDGMSLLMWCAGGGTNYDGLDAVGFGSPAGPCRVSVADGTVTRGGRLPDEVNLGWEAAVSPVLARIAFERSGPGPGAVASGETTSLDGEFIEMVDSVAARKATNVAEGSRDLARELEARQYMERRRAGQEDAASGIASDIFVVDFLGGPARRLTSDGRSRAPAWTSDGTKILYTSGSELWMMDAEGGQRQPVVSGSPKIAPYSTVALTPDGNHVLFVAAVEANEGLAMMMTGETPADLHIARIGGSTARRLTNRHSFKQRFALSPDAKRIVYEVIADTGTLTDSRTRSELWMMVR
jgi:Tol biopolymer transport system component